MTQAKGSKSYFALQQEASYGVAPTVSAATKVYFASESLSKSVADESSQLMRGNREATSPTRGKVDCGGQITTELMSGLGVIFLAALGAVKTTANSGSGEVLGTALTTPTAVIDLEAMTITVTSTTHGIVVGDVVKFETLTAPTPLNNCYCRVIDRPSTSIFVARMPPLTSATFTLGSGTIKKVTTAATTYKHEFTIGSSLPSFTGERGHTDIIQYFKSVGVKTGSLSMDVTATGPQKVNVSLMAKNQTLSQTQLFTTIADLGKATFDGLTLGTIEEGGAPIATVSSISGLSIDNGLDGDTYLLGGGGTRGALNESAVVVKGTAKALFDNNTLYDKAVAGTESSLTIGYERGTGAGTSGNESLTIELGELQFMPKAPQVDRPGGVWVELPFSAYYDDGALGTTAKVTLLAPYLAI